MAEELLMNSTSNSDDLDSRTLAGGSDDDTVVQVEGFNLEQWVAGVRPIRRTVTLYSRLDLMGERDELGAALEDARAAGDNDAIGALHEQIDELTEQILGSRMFVTIEGVTASRFKEIVAEAKDLGLDSTDVFLYQIAAQIVEPKGLDWETFKRLDDMLPTQTSKVAQAWTAINNEVPQVGVTAPF